MIKMLKNQHKKYPASWWKNVDYDMTNDWEDYDKDINKYGVRVDRHMKRGVKVDGYTNQHRMAGINSIVIFTKVSYRRWWKTN